MCLIRGSLDEKGLIERYKHFKKSFAVLRIRPLENDGANLKVSIGVYWVSYKKHRLMFGFSDWSDVGFRFDCAKTQFVVSSVKLGGI